MEFSLSRSLNILRRTPRVLNELLRDLDTEWTHSNDGADTWSPYDVIGHLIQGERTDWMQRLGKIMSADDKHFVPFDRNAHFEQSKGKSLSQLLDEFNDLRSKNIDALEAMVLREEDYVRTGIHPAFGDVTLRHLLSTWTAHDLGHLVQIARTMARQYKQEVGPWTEYLSVMKN